MSARRSNFRDQSVSYGSVGASLAPDLIRFPPRGFWSGELSARLGTGEERFESARDQMWQWAIHTHSGLEIVDVTAGSTDGYRGLQQRSDTLDPNEAVYTVDGLPALTPGASITQRARLWRWSVDLPARVVLVFDEPRRAGYALGSLPGHPFVGEQAFVLEWRDDDAVTITVRQLGQPANPKLRFLGPVIRWQQLRLSRRFVRALHPTSAAQSAEAGIALEV